MLRFQLIYHNIYLELSISSSSIPNLENEIGNPPLHAHDFENLYMYVSFYYLSFKMNL